MEEEEQINSDDSMIDVFFGALVVASLLFIVLMALPHESTGPAMEGKQEEITLGKSSDGKTQFSLYRIVPVAGAEQWPVSRDKLLKTWCENKDEKILLVDAGQTSGSLCFGLKESLLDSFPLENATPTDQLRFEISKFVETDTSSSWTIEGEYTFQQP